MRRLTEGASELTAEVSTREARSVREIIDAQRLRVVPIGQILRPQQVPDRRNERHPARLAVGFSSRGHNETIDARDPGKPESSESGGWAVPGSRHGRGSPLAPACRDGTDDASDAEPHRLL